MRTWRPSYFPLNVMLQSHSHCNSGCEFCPYPSLRDTLTRGYMQDALFTRIIEQLRGRSEVKRILLYLMNEPLLDPALIERIHQAKAACPSAMVHLMTNGLALDPALAAGLIASPLDWVGFSVHAATEETYRRITGREGYRAVVENIKDFLRLAGAAGKDLSRYVMINLTRSPEHLADPERDQALATWRNLGITRVEYFDHPISRAGNVPTIQKAERQGLNGCASIWATEMLHVLFNGDVVPCCMDWSREQVLGNLERESIESLWNGPAYTSFRKQLFGLSPLPPDFLCTRCEASIPMTTDTSPPAVIVFDAPLGEDDLHHVLHRLEGEAGEEFFFSPRSRIGVPETLFKFLELLDSHDLRHQHLALSLNRYDHLDEATLRSLRDFGVQRLYHFGGSFCAETLRRRNLSYTPRQLAEVLQRCIALGLRNDVQIDLCFPGETEEQFRESVAFVARHHALLNGTLELRPFSFERGSVFHLHPERYGLIIIDDAFLDGWHYQGYNNHSYRRKKLNEFQIVLNHFGVANRMHALTLIERRDPTMEAAVIRRLVGPERSEVHGRHQS